MKQKKRREIEEKKKETRGSTIFERSVNDMPMEYCLRERNQWSTHQSRRDSNKNEKKKYTKA